MSRLLGAVTRRATSKAIQQRTGRIERHGPRGRRRARLASRLAGGDSVDGAKHITVAVVLDDRRRGARFVDSDGDHDAGEEALVELPWRAFDVERAITTDTPSDARGERGRERGLVD